jgi:hypothetical protein
MSIDKETGNDLDANVYEDAHTQEDKSMVFVPADHSEFNKEDSHKRFEPFYDFTDINDEHGPNNQGGGDALPDSTSEFYQDFSDESQIQDSGTVSWCIAVLQDSPTALAMLSKALEEGWSIALDDLDHTGRDFEIDIDEAEIVLNNNGLSDDAILRSGYFKTITLTSLVQALRQIWQDKRHDQIDITLRPQDLLMNRRLRAADLDIVKLAVAWELRAGGQGEGHGQVWRHLIGSEEGDLALAFSQSLERGKIFTKDANAEQNIGYTKMVNAAMTASFYQWFRSEERVNKADHKALREIDQVLLEDDVQALSAQDKGQRALTGGQVELLSCLPNKTAYLLGFGAEILSDPHFAGLYDPTNQAHLMHIAYDMKVVDRSNVAFQSTDLAARMFPASNS